MDEAGKKKLWEEYARTKSPEVREKIILEYAPLVKVVAGRLSMYLGYNVEYEDLVSYGIFGLIDAIDKFDFLKDVKFETYASLRIRGSILDQIRKMDWIPRTIRQKQKKIDAVIREIETRYGRSATDEEISIIDLVRLCARKLGMGEPEIIFNGYRESDPERRLLNTDKIRNRTGWRPQITLEQGIGMCVEEMERV